MKKTFNHIFLSIITLISILIPSFNISFSNLKDNSEIQNKNSESIITKSISPLNLTDDIESLNLSLNLKNETISYNITFKTNEFDGSEVKAFFYVMDEYYTNPWLHVDFENSTSIVENRYASNTTSYSQIFDYNERDIITSYGAVRISIAYKKNNEFIAANLQPFEFYLFESTDGNVKFSIDDSKTIMRINDSKTWGQIDFSFTNDPIIELNNIYLKSTSDLNLNQNIYTKNNSNALLQGDNSITFELLSNYQYYDLYLDFVFVQSDKTEYIWSSSIVNQPNFTSSRNDNSTRVEAILFLIFIIILILITIIFIILIFKQLNRRKNLERNQK